MKWNRFWKHLKNIFLFFYSIFFQAVNYSEDQLAGKHSIALLKNFVCCFVDSNHVSRISVQRKSMKFTVFQFNWSVEQENYLKNSLPVQLWKWLFEYWIIVDESRRFRNMNFRWHSFFFVSERIHTHTVATYSDRLSLFVCCFCCMTIEWSTRCSTINWFEMNDFHWIYRNFIARNPQTGLSPIRNIDCICQSKHQSIDHKSERKHRKRRRN